MNEQSRNRLKDRKQTVGYQKGDWLGTDEIGKGD